VVLLFSGMVRGGFPVLLLSLAYYGICSGLPVVRDSLSQASGSTGMDSLLQALTAIFPDFSRLDFKDMVVSNIAATDTTGIVLNFALLLLYTGIVITLACRVYARRDLQ
jgi:Cu-processing system permease protein